MKYMSYYKFRQALCLIIVYTEVREREVTAGI